MNPEATPGEWRVEARDDKWLVFGPLDDDPCFFVRDEVDAVIACVVLTERSKAVEAANLLTIERERLQV